MATFLEAVGDGVRALTCGVLSDAERSVEWVADRVGTPQVGAETVKQLRRWVCSNPDDEVDLPSPPFTGGQCPGVLYNVQVHRVSRSRRRCSTGATSVIAINNFITPALYGPISGLRNVFSNPGACGPATVTTFLDGFDASGDPQSVNVFSSAENAAFWEALAPDIQIVQITRQDGQPDNCGDPTGPPIPPYVPVTINQNITYINNENIEITEDVDFTLLAPVFIGGAIIAPVRIDVGGVEIPLNFSLETGEITFDFSRDFIEPPTPVVDPTPIPNPTDDEPEVESDDLIYGLIVYSTPSGVGPVTSSVAQSQAPDLRLPRTGNVYFQVPIGDRVSWVGPIPTQIENQLVLTPGGLGATGYRLVPNTGWQMSAVRVGKPS